MERNERIRKEIVKRIIDNGGHQATLDMENGDKLYIVRKGQTSFERLERDSFDIFRNNIHNRVMRNGELMSVANWIDETY